MQRLIACCLPRDVPVGNPGCCGPQVLPLCLPMMMVVVTRMVVTSDDDGAMVVLVISY